MKEIVPSKFHSVFHERCGYTLILITILVFYRPPRPQSPIYLVDKNSSCIH